MGQENTKPLFHRIPDAIGVSTVLCWVSCLTMALAISMVFFYAPIERNMRIVQKISYFHISSTWIAFLAFFIVMAASIGFLSTGKRRWDIFAHASAEIGTLFCTLVLVTGLLRDKPVWNTWWTWDVRLTTTLVLWLMYLGYLMLRAYTREERSAKYTAVFGIIAFSAIPVVYFSVRWWRRLHPAPVVAGKIGFGQETEMLITLFVCLLAFTCLFLYLIQHRIALLRMELELDDMRQVIANQNIRYGYLVEDYNVQEYEES